MAGPALAAENFDGTYTGKRVLTKGSDPTCPKEDPVSVTIRGESLTFSDSALHEFATGFDHDRTGHLAKSTPAPGAALCRSRVG